MNPVLDGVGRVAVVGVSRDADRWGYKVLMRLKSLGFEVVGVNPKHELIEGVKCVSSVKDVWPRPDLVVTVVQPVVTGGVVQQCGEVGIGKVWMQPGSEPFGYAQGKSVVSGIEIMTGACIVVDGLNETW